MTTSTTSQVRVWLEAATSVLLFALLLWVVRGILQPLLVFPLVFFLLWPTRTSVAGFRALVVVAVLFAAWLVDTVGAVLVPFLLALAIAYLLAPAVDALQARRVPRPLGVALVLLPFLGLLVGLALLLVPEIERQLLDLVGRLPELGQRVAAWMLSLRERLIASGGGGLFSDAQVQKLQNLQASDLVAVVSSRLGDISERIWAVMLGIGRGFGAGLGLVLTLLSYFVVAPIVAAYLLASWPRFTQHCVDLVPPKQRPAVFGFLGEYDVMLGRFVRGQLIEAALVAVLTTVGLWITGFPAAILMGVVAGIGNLIPQVGLFLSIIPGLLIALVQPAIGPALLKLIAVFGVVQIIDGQVTGPRIVGGAVGLSPVWSMVAVLVFGSLFGLLGMFLAVPLAALVRLIVLRVLTYYRAAPIYSEVTEVTEAER